MPIKNHHRNKTPQRYLHRVSLKAQSGAVLLLFVLLIVIGSSYALVTKLNTNLALTQQSKETGIALSAAKNALISYAITFPDHNASGVIDGPGYLLCPDLNNDGSAVANCSIGGGTTIGRLPNQTLRLEELRDASGQRLWYALSQNFRFGNNKTIPLNSESPSSAELSINGVGDIVAVIIAPGAPVDSQTRDINEIDIADEIEHYLEGDNNDLDANYITTLGDFQRKDGEYDANDNYTFNDQVVFITRKELMEAVEKRVLGEVKQTLLNYQTNNGAFPWLSPFADPTTSNYLWTVNTYNGHLPLHIVAQAYVNNTAFSVEWSGLPVVSEPITTGMPPAANCLSNANCTDLFGNVRNEVTPLTNVTCTWQNRYSFNCTGTDDGITSPGLIRTYTINYADDGTSNLTFNPPTVSLPRARNLSIADGSLTGDLTITISDMGTNTGSTSFTFPAGTKPMSLRISGVDYHLDATGVADVVDPGEQADLPDWITNNNWHHLIYIAYASGETLPGDTTDTTPADGIPDHACMTLDTQCLVLNNAKNDNKRALAMIAGEDLTAQRPSGALADYFENGNATPLDDNFCTDYFENGTLDDNFCKGQTTDVFNDQIKVISISP